MQIRPVAADEWEIVAWLWQVFRGDLTSYVDHSRPYPDGRYKHDQLADFPGPGRGGLLAWEPHPQAGVLAPVGFSLWEPYDAGRMLSAFYVVPDARRGGTGTMLATQTLASYDGPWTVAFQHANEPAARFWRAVATLRWGDRWTEERRPVPKPEVPDDHFILGPATTVEP